MGDDGRSGGAERRVDPRVPLHSEIKNTYPDREELLSGICGNVSLGGMFVEMNPRDQGVIYRIIDRFTQGGGWPFDLEMSCSEAAEKPSSLT